MELLEFIHKRKVAIPHNNNHHSLLLCTHLHFVHKLGQLEFSIQDLIFQHLVGSFIIIGAVESKWIS